MLKHAPEPARWIPFVYCLESTPGGPNDAAAAACAKASKIDYAGVIEPCATGPEGLALEADSAAATAALQPPHQYVPWVTLSSAPGAGTFCTEAGCDDFVAAVCAAYTGPKPAACPAAGAAAPKLRGVSGVHHKD